MSAVFQNEGYELAFLVSNHLDPAARANWKNKVVHCGASTPVLAEHRTDHDFLVMVDAVVNWYKRFLSLLGIWDEFRKYAEECTSNPHCLRYLKV